MNTTMQVMAAAIAVASVIVALPGSLGDGVGDVPWDVGLGLTVNSHRIALQVYCTAREGGRTVRDQAWPIGLPSRGEAGVRSMRLCSVPNVYERVRRGVHLIRTLGGAARTVAGHWLAAGIAAGGTAAAMTGERDADRR